MHLKITSSSDWNYEIHVLAITREESQANPTVAPRKKNKNKNKTKNKITPKNKTPLLLRREMAPRMPSLHHNFFCSPSPPKRPRRSPNQNPKTVLYRLVLRSIFCGHKTVLLWLNCASLVKLIVLIKMSHFCLEGFRLQRLTLMIRHSRRLGRIRLRRLSRSHRTVFKV